VIWKPEMGAGFELKIKTHTRIPEILIQILNFLSTWLERVHTLSWHYTYLVILQSPVNHFFPSEKQSEGLSVLLNVSATYP